ncbi:3-demethylubiquinone-9 3-methyltransferase [Desulfitobacterium hafniense DCB-2]|uniref:3-demethylubiquinone-9 3-methyltransferase n=1 Tax=Desulfitobacterium hafniense (strain DSM 10664 / DCB-2) TaxID=272564 RepID=B8G077_DESHD|nr:VOC family protein [Desulfitobacterium hafniense]ACL21138.1 3-demethylubiquinone-9 3-methyltransferase [Desulfitobacterium hafniense DCB-2]
MEIRTFDFGDGFCFKQKIATFLMFQDGNAEEAMNFYISLFDNSKIVNITRYGANEAGQEGTVMHAVFSLNGQEYMCIDSHVKHEFTFTPAISLYVTCDSKEEIDKVFEKLLEGGQILMPLGSYPFSERFGWVNDKYGVSWQLNFEK